MSALAAVRSRAGAAAAAVLLLGALGLGAEHTVHQGRSARTQIQRADRQARTGNRAQVFRGTRDRFIDFVRATVPAHADVRVVEGVRVGGRVVPQWCATTTSGPGYWWLVYSIAPRASVCDAATTWTVYFGVDPPATTGGTLYRYAPGYAVVRR